MQRTLAFVSPARCRRSTPPGAVTRLAAVAYSGAPAVPGHRGRRRACATWPRGRDGDVAVLGAKHAHRRIGRVVVADLLRQILRHGPARCLKSSKKIMASSKDACTHWPSPDVSRSNNAVKMPLAQSSPAPTSESAAPERIGPGRAHRSPSYGRPSLARWDQRQDGPRPILAEAGNAAIDDARIDRLDGLVINAQAVLHVGAVILDNHIGLARQLLENGEPAGVLQIQESSTVCCGADFGNPDCADP